MRSHLFIGISVVCVVVVSFVACGGGASSGSVSETSSTLVADSNMLTVRLPLIDDTVKVRERSDVKVPARSYDTIAMGRIAHGDLLEGTFRIVNESDKPLVIVQVITGCSCTVVDYDPAPIAPNGQRDMIWQFDSKGRLGHQFKSIEVITSSKQCATVYLDGDIYMQ